MSKLNIRNRKRKDGSNNWEYRFEGASVDGKRKQISKSGFATKKEALEEGTKALAEYNRVGSRFEPSDISVSDYLDYWFENYCKMNLKYSTQESYEIIITKHLKPQLGFYKLKALTPAICQEWVNKIYVNSGLSKNTLVGITTTLSAALKYAVEPARFIESSPMTYVKFPKTKKTVASERFVIEKDVFDKMCDRLKDTPYYYALMIGYYTGMRISEVYGLTWDDIDFTEKTISVKRQILKRNYEINIKIKKNQKQEKSSWCISSLKTDSSERTIKIGDTLLNALKKLKKQQLENELLYGEFYIKHYLKEFKDEKGDVLQRIVPIEKSIECAMTPINLVFTKENGEYSSTDSFKYAARVIHHELGINFNFHSLRHTHATKLIEAGIPVKTVQTRLGHAFIQTTLQTYAHTTEQMEQNAVDSFEKILSTK